MTAADLYCTGFLTKFGLTTLHSLQYCFVSCTGKSHGPSEYTATSSYPLLPVCDITVFFGSEDVCVTLYNRIC
jgi:hypothetical protein